MASQVMIAEMKKKESIKDKEIEELKRQLQLQTNHTGFSVEAQVHASVHTNNSKSVLPGTSSANSILPSTPGGRKRHSSQHIESLAKSRYDPTVRPPSIPNPNLDAIISMETSEMTSEGRAAFNKVIENQIEGDFMVHNDGAFRSELEIAFMTLNKEKFSGSITPQEAKHDIFKKCLGFGDGSNFDGVRFEYRGGPVAIFKFKSAINVDELLPIQNFEYRRKSSWQGCTHVDIIGCKIRGLRSPELNQKIQANKARRAELRADIDDGVRTIRIEGCSYRIPKEVLVEYLSFFGRVESNIVEETFDDGSDPMASLDGTNRTGVYAVKLKLNGAVPELLPILGRRIKISYPGIQRLCTSCFGHHPRRVCKSKKVAWQFYVNEFMKKYPEIPTRLYGRWAEQNLNPNYVPVQDKQESTKMNAAPNAGADVLNCTQVSALSATAEWVLESGGPTKVDVTLEPHSMNEKGWEKVTHSKRHSNPMKAVVEIGHVDTMAPNKELFLLPTSTPEFNKAIDNLVKGGSTPSEAQSILNQRSTSFNKAMREYKKKLVVKTTNSVTQIPQKKNNTCNSQPNQSQNKNDEL